MEEWALVATRYYCVAELKMPLEMVKSISIEKIEEVK
jgi:hypothetical protein